MLVSGIFRVGYKKFLCCKEKITMFDKIRLKEILVEYKKRFVQKQWPDENFKWEAVKCFQDNWDVNADDFSGMLKKSLSKTDALLASPNNFPAQMIMYMSVSIPSSKSPTVFSKGMVLVQSIIIRKKIQSVLIFG